MGEAHLVVDGSNIATEGRSLPSLQQLLDAVDAVRKENDYANVTVVVDATFGHRIDESERPDYEKRLEEGEIITPPAGVIGRGDAFILEVADRVDAVVLSNDSFQEFHGTYTWLFDEGRLLGGKHVPGVGWIFLARSPVRGPTSRRAVSEAKRKRRASTKKASRPPKKAASKKQSKKKASASGRGAKKKADESGRKRGGKEPEPYNEPLPFIEFVGAHPVGSVIEAEVEQFSSHGAYVVCDGTRCYISLKAISDPPPRSARDVFTLGETRSFVVDAIDTPRRGIDLRLPDGEKPASRDESDTSGEKADKAAVASEKPEKRAARKKAAAQKKTTAKKEPVPQGAKAETAEKAEQSRAVPSADTEKMSVSQRRKLRAQQEAAKAEAEAADAATAAEKSTPAKKAATKKSATKKRAASKKKAATKKKATKKSATKKKAATKKRAPAKKSATKKKAAAKKRAPAKKSATKKKAAGTDQS